MENNSGFQSELLRTNGHLQASNTELKYRCEVYRLSLRSICKTLSNVQKEQEARLRCLTTIRPSYQSYLLSLSQKQALDRIGNVVKKASTFINGYSLVDRTLFQPPPPQPCSDGQSKQKTSCGPLVNGETGPASSFAKNSNVRVSPKRGTNDETKLCSSRESLNEKSRGTTAPPEQRKAVDMSDGDDDGRRSKEKPEYKENPSFFTNSSSETEGVCYKGNREIDITRDKSVTKTEAEWKSALIPNFRKRNEGWQTKASSKSISCQRLQVIKSRGGYNNNFIKEVADEHQRVKAGLTRRRSIETRNLFGRTSFTSRLDKEKARTEVRRIRRSSTDTQKFREEGSSRNNKTEERMDRNHSYCHPKEIHGINRASTNSTRYRIRESLAVVRHSQRTTCSSNNQGQGVALKCLFSAHQRRSNLQNRNSTTEGAVRRVILNESGKCDRTLNSPSLCYGKYKIASDRKLLKF